MAGLSTEELKQRREKLREERLNQPKVEAKSKKINTGVSGTDWRTGTWQPEHKYQAPSLYEDDVKIEKDEQGRTVLKRKVSGGIQYSGVKRGH